MKVLMFSTDSSILESGSWAQRRMIEYGTLVEKLFIVVLSKKRVKSQILDISQNVRVYSVYFWSAFGGLGKMFKKEGIDLVTAQDPFETGLVGYLTARRLKAKLQLQIHTDFLSQYFIGESLKNRVRVWLAKWLLPKAHNIRVVSERIKKSLSVVKSQLPKVFVLPIFVDITKIKKGPIVYSLKQKYPQFDFFILMASRLSQEKNIGLAIKAMPEVVKNHSKVGLIIIGDGAEEENLQHLIIDGAKLAKNIILEPWTAHLVTYYKTADVFLNISNYEGYGRTLIEAAAAGGVAIITTDVGVVGEVINKSNSLVIPVGDAKALTESILKLIEDKSLRQELSQKAKDAVMNLDGKEVYLQKYKQSWQI